MFKNTGRDCDADKKHYVIIMICCRQQKRYFRKDIQKVKIHYEVALTEEGED